MADFDWKSVITGGISGSGGGTQSAAKLLSGYGPVEQLLGTGKVSNNYDAKGELAKSEGMAGDVYKRALANETAISIKGAPSGRIKAPTALAGPSAIQAQTIGAPSTLTGPEADALRAQQLSQAQTAANSPSSAAAQQRAAAGQIQNQQAGMVARARGADRGTAARDAMIALGQQGMVASNQTSALAAQEAAQKQQAYTQALAGVRSGDVSGAQAQTQIGAANQGANLTAQQATVQNTMDVGKFNTQTDMAAQQASAQNELAGWNSTNAAQNAAQLTGLQAVGAQNQAQGVAANYNTGLNQAETQNKGALMGGVGSFLGKLSDERAKTEVTPFGGGSSASMFGGQLSNAYGMGAAPTSPYGASQDFLSWTPPKPSQDGSGATLSDERTKEQVDAMDMEDVADFTREAPLTTFRYKDGMGEDPDRYQAGTLAQGLEAAGPLGRMFVDERPDGYKEVQYGPLAHAEAKGAQASADKAIALALAALDAAASKSGRKEARR